MKFEDLLEKAESFNRTYSGSSYNDTPDVSGFKGQVSAGSNGIVPMSFPQISDFLKTKKRVAKKKRI